MADVDFDDIGADFLRKWLTKSADKVQRIATPVIILTYPMPRQQQHHLLVKCLA